MRTADVVVLSPALDRAPRSARVAKQRLVQQLVAQALVEALDEGVLELLAWRDVMPVDLRAMASRVSRRCANLRPVFRNPVCRFVPDGDDDSR